MEPIDEELIKLCKEGDVRVFAVLVRRYQSRIQSFIEQQIGNREDARDMTQQTFIQAYSSLYRFREGRLFAPWLFTIARRQGVDFLRSKGAGKNDASRYSEHDLESVRDPSELLSSTEQCQQAWRWVSTQLDQRAYQVLWLYVQEEMPVADIARVVSVSKTHAKVILHRARKKLIAARLERGNTKLA